MTPCCINFFFTELNNNLKYILNFGSLKQDYQVGNIEIIDEISVIDVGCGALCAMRMHP